MLFLTLTAKLNKWFAANLKAWFVKPRYRNESHEHLLQASRVKTPHAKVNMNLMEQVSYG